MKKVFILLMIMLSFSSCSKTDQYVIVSENQVDGFDIYAYQHTGLFCNTIYTDIYYSGPIYNYGFTFQGCSPSMTYFIKINQEYIYLQQALDMEYITLESLLPELDQIERESESFDDENADYVWLDFHINHEVVYAYGGGNCDQTGTEIFEIDGDTYTYTASGCLKEHILYMEVNRIYVPVADLLEQGQIDGTLLIPLLEKEGSHPQ